MRIDLHRYRFVRNILQYAPHEEGGVYLLWQGGEVIYIGRTGAGQNLRQCLLDHQSGALGPCTAAATHYSWEVTAEAVERYLDLLSYVMHEYRRPPRCQP